MIHEGKNGNLWPLQFKRPYNLDRLDFLSKAWGIFIAPTGAHLVQFWAKSEMVPIEALVELGWIDPWNFTANVYPVNIAFSFEIFCIYSFSPKIHKFDPVPVLFSEFSK